MFIHFFLEHGQKVMGPLQNGSTVGAHTKIGRCSDFDGFPICESIADDDAGGRLDFAFFIFQKVSAKFFGLKPVRSKKILVAVDFQINQTFDGELFEKRNQILIVSCVGDLKLHSFSVKVIEEIVKRAMERFSVLELSVEKVNFGFDQWLV